MKNLPNHSHLWPGVPLALASASLFGVTPPLSKILLNDIDPFMLAGLLYLGAGLGLTVYHIFVRSGRQEATLQRQDWLWLTVVIIFGGLLAPVLLMLGLRLIPASSSALLLNFEGLATMAIAWLVFRESVDRRLLIGAFAILAGAVLLSWQGQGFALDTGALLILAACTAWGIDNNLTRKISAADPIVIVAIKGMVAGLINISLALLAGAAMPKTLLIATSLGLGFLCVGVSLVFFILALRHLGTARTGAYFSLAPFIGAVVAIVLLNEPITMTLTLSASLMALGLWLHLTERHAHEHRHELLEHEHVHKHDEHHIHEHDADPSEPHSHLHRHSPFKHAHSHFPDLHHRHTH